jgi:metal-sulfur cluster biosynthetic enzyme
MSRETITNNTILADEALHHLRDVYDPELDINVVDLGLIYQLDFNEQEKQVYVLMTLTTRFCPMGSAITAGVEKCLQQNFPGYEVTVHLSFDPAWTNENMSEDAKMWLGK